MKKTTFYLLSLITLVSFTNMTAQVGVGNTTPAGALDLNPTVATNFGFVPPRVALTALNAQAPVLNPQGGVIPNGTIVWNTATTGTLPNNVSPGLYYWNGSKWISVAGSPGGLDWSIIGNGGIDGGVTGITGTPATIGTNFLGTYDNTNIDIRTNGSPAARFSSLGEFFIGDIETVLPGDLMNGVSEGNPTFPWAINGYTDQNGGGVYGSVTGGTTAFAAVQGEYSGTYASSAGVRGINFASVTVSGTSFSSPISGVNGTLPNTSPGTYSQTAQFGVNGSVPSNTGRTVGGVIGLNFQNGAYGMLGYRRSNGIGYGSLSSTAAGSGVGAKSSSITDTSVGMGTQGGFLGAQIRGNQFGLITKGDLIGQYTDGSSVTTKGFAVISKDAKGNKATTYVPTSTTVDVSTKGTGKLVNGYAKISFDKNYSLLTSKDKPVIVTVSPMGETKGVYVTEVTTDGFIVKENGKGNSNASFFWIAIGEKNNADDMKMPAELLTKDFDSNLDSFLTIDEDVKQDQYEKGSSKAMWWDGKNIVFGNDAPDVKTNGFKVEPTKAERLDPNVKRVVKENLRKAQIDAAVQAKAVVK